MIDPLQAHSGADVSTEKLTDQRNYWIIAALDYDKDEAWIVASSDDCRAYDLIDGRAVSDSIRWNIPNDAVPGLYRLTLRQWGGVDYFGEYDGGVDVDAAELLTPFPSIDDCSNEPESDAVSSNSVTSSSQSSKAEKEIS